MSRFIFSCIAVLLPTQALAFDVGKARVPDWMDQYFVMLLPVAAVGFCLTLMFKPRGVPVNQMYQHFGHFSFLGRIVYAIFGLTVTALLILFFVGMGLQRAAEAGL